MLARVREVLAKMRVDRNALALELALQDLGDQRRTTTAGCRGSGRFLEGTEGRATVFDGGADVAFADIVA